MCRLSPVRASGVRVGSRHVVCTAFAGHGVARCDLSQPVRHRFAQPIGEMHDQPRTCDGAGGVSPIRSGALSARHPMALHGAVVHSSVSALSCPRSSRTCHLGAYDGRRDGAQLVPLDIGRQLVNEQLLEHRETGDLGSIGARNGQIQGSLDPAAAFLALSSPFTLRGGLVGVATGDGLSADPSDKSTDEAKQQRKPTHAGALRASTADRSVLSPCPSVTAAMPLSCTVSMWPTHRMVPARSDKRVRSRVRELIGVPPQAAQPNSTSASA